MSEHTEWYTKPCSVHGHCLLIGPSIGKHEFSLQMPIETANLIATACNSHEKLLVACESIVDAKMDCSRIHGDFDKTCDYCIAYEQAKAAIAAATPN